MTDNSPSYTRAQLYGLACVVCGARDDLAPAGHVYTPGSEPGSRLGWPVAACPDHLNHQQEQHT